MNILMDTHILIWALTDDHRLSDKARNIILSDHSTLYYSVISLWEISIKHDLYPEEMRLSPEVVERCCKDAGYYGLPLVYEHVLGLSSLKQSDNYKCQKDPFDRILLSQAKTEGLSFITHDSLFKGYDEDCIIIV